MAIKLYPHNQETYAKIQEILKTEDRVYTEQPPGTGKSFLYLKWIEDNQQGDTLLFAPSTEIFTQLYAYARESECERILNNVQMLSYQTLITMDEESLAALQADRIIVDEFHHLGAEQWGPLTLRVMENNPHATVLGGTATPVRYLDSARDMGEEIFHGSCACSMTLGEAVRRGILPQPVYVPVWYDIDNVMEAHRRRIAQEKDDGKRRGLEDLLDKIQRNLQDSYGAEDIFEKYMPHDHGKYIVFCRNRQHLDEMIPAVVDWLRRMNKNVRSYISISENDSSNVQLTAFRNDTEEDAVRLLFTISRFDEGLHIRGIDGCIMLRPTESPAVYIQQMGRALASGSKMPLIFDFVNNYGNVQVYSESAGGLRNVFEREWRDAETGSSVEFRIFDRMVEFNEMLGELESALYPSHDERWNETFSLLCEFRVEYHRWPKQGEKYKGASLGLWCNTQRQRAKAPDYPADRRQKLEEIGFQLGIKSFDETWDQMFALLCEFHANYDRWPTFSEEYDGNPLGVWCATQRNKAKSSKYPAERRHRLESIGYPLETTDRDKKWNTMFALLCEFYAEHHRWPKRDEQYKGEPIADWCHWQRKCAKEQTYPADRRERLEAIGFKLETKNLDAAWDKMYALLCEFRKEHHRWPKQKEQYKGEKLGIWCIAQRQRGKKSNYPADHRQKLEDIGFSFDPQSEKWDQMYLLLCEFRKEHHRWPMTKEAYHGMPLGAWCVTQRYTSKSLNYPADRRQKLEDIGFPVNS